MNQPVTTQGQAELDLVLTQVQPKTQAAPPFSAELPVTQGLTK